MGFCVEDEASQLFDKLKNNYQDYLDLTSINKELEKNELMEPFGKFERSQDPQKERIFSCKQLPVARSLSSQAQLNSGPLAHSLVSLPPLPGRGGEKGLSLSQPEKERAIKGLQLYKQVYRGY